MVPLAPGHDPSPVGVDVDAEHAVLVAAQAHGLAAGIGCEDADDAVVARDRDAPAVAREREGC